MTVTVNIVRANITGKLQLSIARRVVIFLKFTNLAMFSEIWPNNSISLHLFMILTTEVNVNPVNQSSFNLVKRQVIL